MDTDRPWLLEQALSAVWPKTKSAAWAEASWQAGDGVNVSDAVGEALKVGLGVGEGVKVGVAPWAKA
jgi:hypothetical protein